MPELLPQHGGLTDPVSRTVLQEEVADFRRQAASLKKVPVSDADLSSLYHPGGRMTLGDPREMLLGGEVRVLPQPKHPEYGQFVLSPRETRALFKQKGWERIVAFQTRNPLHRAHEYALVIGVEKLTRDGHFAGAVLNPLVGETKGDDVDAATRMRTYRALIENKALGQGDVDEELWKRVGRSFSDHVMLLALDIK